MAKDDDKEELELRERESQETSEEKRVYLDQGRSLSVAREGDSQVVEFRAASGQLELRVKLTEDGPVLVLEGVKVQVHTAESFEVKCKEFKVEATGNTLIASEGELKIKSDGELELDSPQDVRIKGKTIWLN